jgi:5-methyltetrahydrofolate--homocysteine methyltransferase
MRYGAAAVVMAFDEKGREKNARLHLTEARRRRLQIDWAGYAPPKPSLLGVKALRDYDLATLVRYIDWTPFFAAWDLTGRYPQILEDETRGETARSLYADARKLLNDIVEKKLLTAHGVVGFWPANADGDDIVLYTDEPRKRERARLFGLRQQIQKREESSPNYCLSDFVAPVLSGVPDYIGAFAVTAGVGEEALAAFFESRADNYSAILAKALADRLAEAFAEHLHERVRREFWGYEKGPEQNVEALIREEYQGIRPAPGYPAQPDHTEKTTLFDLLRASETAGMGLTESCAMTPPSSVCGLYFSHPKSVYFGVGHIGRDQVEDYARRKGMSVLEVERWLAPILAYD